MSDQNCNDSIALGLSRRALLAAAGGLAVAAAPPARAAITNTDFRGLPPYGNGTLPAASPCASCKRGWENHEA
jgi:hypothetical protein